MFESDAKPIDLESRRAQREKLGGFIETGLDYLDDRLGGGLLKTDLILIGAETGAGKTTFAQLLAMQAAIREQRPTFFALEAYEGEVADRFLFRELSRLAWEGKHPDRDGFTFRRWIGGECRAIENEYRDVAEGNIANWCGNIRTRYRGSKFTVDDIRRELLAVQNETDFYVFDHIHYVDNDDSNENRGMKTIIQGLRDVCIRANKPVIAVAHLRKSGSAERSDRIMPHRDDFHGSSDLTKIATGVVVLAPSFERPRDASGKTIPHKALTYIRVEKERYDGASDRYVGKMTFDLRTGTYDPGYTLHELDKAREEALHVAKDERPTWARRATWPDESTPFKNPARTERDVRDVGDDLARALAGR